MRYFMDAEFLEGTQDIRVPFFNFKIGKTKPTIDLISIGIVSEDNRQYYAVSKDFNLKEAWNRGELKTVDVKPIKARRKRTSNSTAAAMILKKVYWIRENVLKPIYVELQALEYIENGKSLYDGYTSAKLHTEYTKVFVEALWNETSDKYKYKALKRLINKYGKTNKQIAEEIKEFVKKDYLHKNGDTTTQWVNRGNPEFYSYYADYHWVVFCWLFDKMNDLSNSFPKYCINLKQTLDETQLRKFGDSRFTDGSLLNDIKKLPNYPKHINEHNALNAAKWNKELYEFLNKLN